MKKLFVLIGVPGSGKSTWIKNSESVIGDSFGVFSLDSCRLAFANTSDYNVAFNHCIQCQAQFDEFVRTRWLDALNLFDTVVVDNVNASRKSRSRWINEAKAKGFEAHAVQFVVPLEVAVARQLTRGDKFVPTDVITRMYYSIQEPLVPSEFVSVTNVKSF